MGVGMRSGELVDEVFEYYMKRHLTDENYRH